MDISTFFRPLDESLKQSKYLMDSYAFGNIMQIYFDEFPDISQADIVVIGCDEDRGAQEIQGAGMAPDLIRKALFRLAVPSRGIKIADLGNFVKAETMVRYYDDLGEVCWELLKRGKIIILLGGAQDITYGQYKGYEKLKKEVEYVAIDSELDVVDSDFGINNHSFNHKIFLHSPNYLFNFTNLGFQSHFTPLSDRKRLKNLNFLGVRLGLLKEDIKEAEPYLRDADLVSFDLSVVRSSDAPGTTRPSPAGLSTEEICQLARYAGMAHKVSSISICEAHPLRDTNEQTTLLAAMLVWYFVEGFYNRTSDEPIDLSGMVKYRVAMNGGKQEIIFYRNELTGRWWMEVPYSDAIGVEGGRTKLIPCSENDYKEANKDNIPEKWWLTHYKLR